MATPMTKGNKGPDELDAISSCPSPLAPSSSLSLRTHKSRPAHKGCQVSAIRQSRDVCPIGVYCEENEGERDLVARRCLSEKASYSLSRPPATAPRVRSALKWLRWEAMNRRSNGSFLLLFRHPRAAAFPPQMLGTKDKRKNDDIGSLRQRNAP